MEGNLNPQTGEYTLTYEHEVDEPSCTTPKSDSKSSENDLQINK